MLLSCWWLACATKDLPDAIETSPSVTSSAPPGGTWDPPADTDVETDVDTDTDTDADTDADTDTDTDTDTAPVDVVRFVALGDGGEGNDTQYRNADAVEVVCAERGCDFALYLGDNFYDSGVSGVDDVQFQDKFELPYANLHFPFYISLGNHDYGGEGLGWELWKGSIYVDYSAYSDKWTMYDLYYTFSAGPVDFFALDTTQVFWGLGGDQEDWLQTALAVSGAEWKVAFGHHYRSNGPHGNAGDYEGLGALADIPGFDIAAGVPIQEFMERAVCGQIDLYLCGHDHDLQWLEPACGTELIVSGAAAKTSDLEGSNATRFEYDDLGGFTWVEIAGNHLTASFFDEYGALLHEGTITR
jgi:hypothetical protein